MVRGEKLLDEVRRWPVPDEDKARVALGEAFTEHGRLPDIKALWNDLIQGNPGRGGFACGPAMLSNLAATTQSTRLSRGSSSSGPGKRRKVPARRGRSSLPSWSKGRSKPGRKPSYRVSRRLSAIVGREQPRWGVSLWTRSSGRFGRWTSGHWPMSSDRFLAPFVGALVEEAAAGLEPGDLEEFNHAWSDPSISSGVLGWLAALVKVILDLPAAPDLLASFGTWIPKMSPPPGTRTGRWVRSC